MDYPQILKEIRTEIQPFWNEGAVASYIPELATITGDQFGMHIRCLDGANFCTGASEHKFSIQSITKVLTLSMVFGQLGERIWHRVDVEPSGNPFNSLVQLEYENGIPRNPLINAGAIVICDMLMSILKNPEKEYLQFVRRLANNDSIDYNRDVLHSEMKHGFRNAAMANLLKAYDNIENEVEAVLEFYYFTCAVEMNCQELADAFGVFANQGVTLHDERRILTGSQTKRVNAIMQTCGFYDESGEFTFKVGIPGKSGVGGGIAAIYPQAYSVAVWSPRLNEKGNSVLGMKALELLTTKTGLSIF